MRSFCSAGLGATLPFPVGPGALPAPAPALVPPPALTPLPAPGAAFPVGGALGGGLLPGPGGDPDGGPGGGPVGGLDNSPPFVGGATFFILGAPPGGTSPVFAGGLGAAGLDGDVGVLDGDVGVVVGGLVGGLIGG